jgi:hypothetical protein
MGDEVKITVIATGFARGESAEDRAARRKDRSRSRASAGILQ